MLNEFLCCSPRKNMYQYSASRAWNWEGRSKTVLYFVFYFPWSTKIRWRYKITLNKFRCWCVPANSSVQYDFFLIKCSNTIFFSGAEVNAMDIKSESDKRKRENIKKEKDGKPCREASKSLQPFHSTSPLFQQLN